MNYDEIKDSPHIVIVETDDGLKLYEFEGENARDNATEFVNSHIGGNFNGRLITAVRYRQTGNYDYAKQTNTGLCR